MNSHISAGRGTFQAALNLPVISMSEPLTPDLLEHAADLISQADALIVAAGASHALAEIDGVLREGTA